MHARVAGFTRVIASSVRPPRQVFYAGGGRRFPLVYLFIYSGIPLLLCFFFRILETAVLEDVVSGVYIRLLAWRTNVQPDTAEHPNSYRHI
jgi:hypothetical protein